MKRSLWSIGWVLVGLLAIAALVISAGNSDLYGKPEADSFRPYGTAALFTLLKEKGYNVDIDRSAHPSPQAGDVAIAFYDDEIDPLADASDQSDEEDQAKADLDHATDQGAIVIKLPFGTDFAGASSLTGDPRPYVRQDGQTRMVTSFRTPRQTSSDEFPILGTNRDCFIGVTRRGKGYSIRYADSLGITNRYIDKGQNAQVFLETLQAFAPPNARIFFTEATIGNGHEKGLLETIGAWALGAWYQILFLFLVVIYTLNRRFGLPEQYRSPQRGARELLDAITDIYTRAKASGAALEAAAARTESQLRSRLKVPMDAGPGELNRLLPEGLVVALSNVKAASEIRKTRPADALALIQKLETETDNFLAEHRVPERRRRKHAA